MEFSKWFVAEVHWLMSKRFIRYMSRPPKYYVDHFNHVLDEGELRDNLTKINVKHPPKKPFHEIINHILQELYVDEQFNPHPPKRPRLFATSAELDHWTTEYERYIDYVQWHSDYARTYSEVRMNIQALLGTHLPGCFTEEEGAFRVSLLYALRKPQDFMRKLIEVFTDRKPLTTSKRGFLFGNLTHQFQGLKTQAAQHHRKGREPTDYPHMPLLKLREEFFRDTAVERLLKHPVYFHVPWHEKHALIVAPTGGGKSQLIETLFLDLIKDPKHSIVIIDSKGGYRGLFERISKLDVFNPDHGEHKDRLILIDPTDEPALGAFVGGQLNELLRAWPGIGEYTDLQRRIMNHVVPVITEMRGNFTDAIELLRNPMTEKFQQALEHLPDEKRFWKEYDRKDYSASLPGLEGRLDLVRSAPVLGKIFNARENKLDFFRETLNGKVILVSTAFKSLEHGYSEVLTNYFLALAFGAGVRRDRYRPDTFIIVDEAVPFINDITAKNFITLREYNMHCVYAVQSAKLVQSHWDAIGKNTGIFFASALKDDERAFMKNYMGGSVDFFHALRKESERPEHILFGCAVDGVTHDDPLTLTMPTGLLDRAGFMSDVAYQELRRLNKERFAAPPTPDPEPEPEDEPEPTGERKPKPKHPLWRRTK